MTAGRTDHSTRAQLYSHLVDIVGDSERETTRVDTVIDVPHLATSNLRYEGHADAF